jgi:hypothetical protein
MSASVSLVDDISDYPSHEEDDVPEGSLHHRWADYLGDVIAARFPDQFVTGNVCVYWEPRNYTAYVAPDVFLADGHIPDPTPRVYRSWLLPRLRFAGEIGSFATALRGAKLGDYAIRLRPAEVLYTEPVDEEKGEMLTPEKVHLYRWKEATAEYEEMERLPNGRFWSGVLELQIGVDENRNLRLYTRDGEPLLYHKEAELARVVAEQARIEAEQARTEAERRARQWAQERAQEAHARVVAEEERAQEAQARVAAEQARDEAENRAAEERVRREDLERQLAVLQARLDRAQDVPEA